ncbi:hypothetical protein GJ496_002633 [Pomphorhynchus laevis]|nr:hypothetical protein GJ496_002633 [Pomphorhynchus laevis]
MDLDTEEDWILNERSTQKQSINPNNYLHPIKKEKYLILLKFSNDNAIISWKKAHQEWRMRQKMKSYLKYINKFNLAQRTPKTFAQASKFLSAQPHINTSITKKQAPDKRQSFEIDPYKEKNQTTIEEEKYENLNNIIKNQNDIIIQLKDTIVKLSAKLEKLELALNEQRIGPAHKDTDRVHKEGSMEYSIISKNKERKDKEAASQNSTKYTDKAS